MFSPFLRALVAALLSSTGFAQQRPAAATSADNGETVHLNAFTVTTDKDTGYIAADVISAGRLSTNLLKTPADITVLTRDFMDDVGAVDLNEAARWLTSSDVSFPVDRDYGTTVSFRGLPSSGNTRNYFKQAYTVEGYIMERLEGSRGPNSILYGDSLIGGQVNAITKRASFNRDFLNFKSTFDSEGSVYLYLDVNRKLTDTLAVRLNSQFQEAHSWQDNYFDNRYAGDLTFTYRPWRRAEIRFEAEQGFSSRMTRADYLVDQASNWDGVTGVSAPLTGNLAGAGINRVTTTNRYVYINGLGIIDFQNWGESSGSGLTILYNNDGTRRPNQPVLPRKSFNLQPTDYHSSAHSRNYSLFMEQSFDSGLVVELAGDHSQQERDGIPAVYRNVYVDVNRLLPDGRANPNFGKNYALGSGTRNPWGFGADYYTGGRIAAAYPFKTEKFSQTVSSVVQYREHLFDVNTWNMVVANGTNPNRNAGENQLKSRRYFDETNLSEPVPENDPRYQLTHIAARDSQNPHEEMFSMQLNTVGSYFRDRLTAIAGIRWDKYEADTRDIAERDPITAQPISTRTNLMEMEIATKSLGAVFFPVPWIGGFANYSEGFRPAGPAFGFPQLLGGSGFATAQSESKNAGLRLNLFGGKIVGSIGYYESNEQNKDLLLATSTINNIWNIIDPDKRVLGGGYASYFDTIDTQGTGWEVDLTANPTKGLRVKANVAFPETMIVRGAAQTRDYLEVYRATWQAAAANPAYSANQRATIANNLATLEGRALDNSAGRKLNNLFDYRANIFMNYEFQHGTLKGLRLGGGAHFFGRKQIGSVSGRPFDYLYSDAYILVSASVGYRLKVREVPIDLQMNIDNVLDYDEPIYANNGLAVVGGVTYRNTYTYEAPRRARFTANFRF